MLLLPLIRSVARIANFVSPCTTAVVQRAWLTLGWCTSIQRRLKLSSIWWWFGVTQGLGRDINQGTAKQKNYLWNVHQQTCQTRLWLPREGLVHQTGAWLSMSAACCVWGIWRLSLWEKTELAQKKIWWKAIFKELIWLYRSYLRLWFLSFFFTAFFCFNKNLHCVSACGELQMC